MFIFVAVHRPGHCSLLELLQEKLLLVTCTSQCSWTTGSKRQIFRAIPCASLKLHKILSLLAAQRKTIFHEQLTLNLDYNKRWGAGMSPLFPAVKTNSRCFSFRFVLYAVNWPSASFGHFHSSGWRHPDTFSSKMSKGVTMMSITEVPTFFFWVSVECDVC